MGSPDPLALYCEWGRRYGDIFYYRMLHRHIYFVNEPELVKQVLVTDAASYIKGEAVRYNRRIFGKGLVANEGESWRTQRRLIQPAFHRERIEGYGRTMVAYTERMIAGWRDGEVRDIHQDMMRLALEIVAMTLFSVEIAGADDRVSVALDTLMQASSGARMLLPPLLRMVPTPGNLRSNRAARELDRIVYQLIGERRARGPGAVRADGDLLDTLLEAEAPGDAAGGTEQVRDEVMTLLLTGHETTAVSLSWIWYLLAQNPEVEAKLWAELGEVLGGRTPTMAHLARLPYTDRVVKEAMRVYPPVWAVVRSAARETELGKYRVPAGSSVILSPYVMHRDARYYDEPERFDPDRWIGEQIKANPKFAYFPFAGGPRVCIGASFATMEAALVLATVAQRFRMRLVGETKVEAMPSITLRPKGGVRLVLQRR